MQVTFLGTGTSMGVPVICCRCGTCNSGDFRDKRLRTSVLIETEKLNIVIDAGPDFRQQMLREDVSKLHAVLITHAHKDHIAGLDDVRAFNYFMNKPMDVYGTAETLDAIKNEFAYVFTTEKYPGAPEINLIPFTNTPFNIGDMGIIPIKGTHYKMAVYGFRIGDLTYITDFNQLTEEEEAKIKGTKVLIINALRKKRHVSHFNLEEALNIIARIAPERAFLTHISHQMGMYEDILSELPKNVAPAYDSLRIIV